MAKGDDILLKILDFIELHWMAIFSIFLLFLGFMSYNVINDIKYEKPSYKVKQIAIIEKLTNMFKKN